MPRQSVVSCGPASAVRKIGFEYQLRKRPPCLWEKWEDRHRKIFPQKKIMKACWGG